MSNVIDKNKLLRWMITCMSHMKTMYEDNDIPWSDENEESFRTIYAHLEKIGASKEVTEEWLEKKVKGIDQLYINCDSLYSRFISNMPLQLRRIFKEMGVGVKNNV